MKDLIAWWGNGSILALFRCSRLKGAQQVWRESVERKNRQRCQTSKCTFVATGTKCRSAPRKKQVALLPEQSARNVARLPGKRRTSSAWEDLGLRRGRGGGPRQAMFGLTGADSYAHHTMRWLRKIAGMDIITLFALSPEVELLSIQIWSDFNNRPTILYSLQTSSPIST